MIRIKHVNVSNVTVHRKFDFDTGRVTIICGPNMSGKTSLLEAIPAGLYGQPVGDSVQDMAGSGKEATIEVDFKVDKSEYRTHLAFNGSAVKKGILYSGKDIINRGEKITSMVETVEQMTGISKALFMTCVPVMRDLSDHIMHMRPADRYAVLSELFELERYEQWRKEYKTTHNSLLGNVQRLEGMTRGLADQGTGRAVESEKLKRVTAKIKRTRSEYREKLEKVQTKIQDVKSRTDRLCKLLDQYDRIETDMDVTKIIPVDSFDQAQSSIPDLLQGRKVLKAFSTVDLSHEMCSSCDLTKEAVSCQTREKKILKQLPGIKGMKPKDIEQVPDQIRKHQRLLNIQDQIGDIDKAREEVEEADSTIKKLGRRRDKLKAIINNYDDKVDTLSELANQAKRDSNATEKIARAENEIAVARGEMTICQTLTDKVFDKTKVPLVALYECIQEISNISNRHLKAASIPYSIRWEVIENKRGTNADINLRIETPNGMRSANRLSGAESKIIATALNIALTTVANIGLILIDELDTLDSDQTVLFNRLIQSAPAIQFVIAAHNPDISGRKIRLK